MEDLRLEWDHWPVLIADLRSEMTAPLMDRFVGAMAEALDRKQKFGLVFLSLAPGFKFDRKLFQPAVDFTNSHRPQLLELCLGNAVVLGSPAYRFMVSSFLLLAKTPNLIKVFSTPEPAGVWIEGVLKANDIPVPAGLAKRLASGGQPSKA